MLKNKQCHGCCAVIDIIAHIQQYDVFNNTSDGEPENNHTISRNCSIGKKSSHLDYFFEIHSALITIHIKSRDSFPVQKPPVWIKQHFFFQLNQTNQALPNQNIHPAR